MNRWLLTITTVACLLGLSQAYERVVAPLTQATAAPEAPDAELPDGPQLSSIAQDMARRHLAGSEWTQQARFVVQRSEEAVIFFNDYEPLDDVKKNQLRFTPFALVWRDPRRAEAAPFVMTADSARLVFLKKFELTGEDAGRVIGAVLEGTVVIQGPDGLRLEGQDFVFNEETRSLYSDGPLSFAFGPTADSEGRLEGQADGIDIRLTAGRDNLLGDDLPQIVDFELLTLRRNVELRALVEQEGRLAPAMLTSRGPFEFHRAEKFARFTDAVQVTRWTSDRGAPDERDVLRCGQLTLHFNETAPPSEGAGGAAAPARGPEDSSQRLRAKARSFASLRLARLVAQSSASGSAEQTVAASSQQYGVSAAMQRLEFDMAANRTTLSDPSAVVVNSRDYVLECPVVQFQHNASRQLDWFRCQGAGRLEQLDAQKRPVAVIDFQDQLNVHPAEPAPRGESQPARRMELRGDVQVQLGPDMALRSDQLELWVEESVFEQGAAAGPGTSLGESRRERGRRSGEATDIPVRRVVASGRVKFATPEATGRSVGRIEVRVEPGAPPVVAARERRQALDEEEGAAAPESPAAPWIIDAGEVQAVLIVDPESLESGVQQVVAEGDVEARRPARTTAAPDDGLMSLDQELAVAGRRLVFRNQGGVEQSVVLEGVPEAPGQVAEPAHLSLGAAHLEGQHLEVVRSDNRAEVEGRVLLRLPVPTDLFGNPHEGPLLLDIECGEGLTFDGEAARFVGSVRLSLLDSRLFCEELTATLNRKLSFTALEEERAGAPPLEIARLDCTERVAVETYEYLESKLVRYIEARLGRLSVDLGVREFSGQGPGRINEWRKGGLRVAMERRAESAANRAPVHEDLEWSYTNLEFAGAITGDFEQRHGTFRDRVKVMYAPVGRAMEEFTRQDLSQDTKSAAGAVWMGCDALQVMLVGGETVEGAAATVQAEGRVLVEARSFHAAAHQLSFEEAKDLFVLRGRGTEMASVYFERRPGDAAADADRFTARVIECVPSRRDVRVDGAAGFSGSQ